MRYALIDTLTGRPYGPYDSRPDKAAAEIPKHRPGLASPAVVELAETDPADLAGLWGVESGGEWGLITRTTQGLADDLVKVKTTAKAQVDEHAESLRLLAVTPGAGQMATYQLKAEELQAYDAVIAASGTPDQADYPICATEIGVTGADLAAVMEVIRANRTAWIAWGAAIEGPRLKAKADIEAAQDQAGVQAVIDNIPWPSLG